MTYAFKKYLPVVLIATVLMAVAHNILTRTPIWQSVVFSLSLIAFLRVVYYIKKCIGGEDSLISFFAQAGSPWLSFRWYSGCWPGWRQAHGLL